MSLQGMQTAGDIPMNVTSENSSSERRITPSWTIAQLRAKLEPVTGIPIGSQKITLSTKSQATVIEAQDEETFQISNFQLAPYATLHVTDLRPPGQRPNYTDVSSVTKLVLSDEQYESKTDTVLAWKKKEHLGRFNPDAPTILEKKIKAYDDEIYERAIEVGKRCRIGEDDTRRGVVMYVGDVEEIPGGAGKWVGVKLDEPLGRNDGSINGKRYWTQEGNGNFGVFVRPERVNIGDFPPMDDLLDDMEEI